MDKMESRTRRALRQAARTIVAHVLHDPVGCLFNALAAGKVKGQARRIQARAPCQPWLSASLTVGVVEDGLLAAFQGEAHAHELCNHALVQVDCGETEDAWGSEKSPGKGERWHASRRHINPPSGGGSSPSGSSSSPG